MAPLVGVRVDTCLSAAADEHVLHASIDQRLPIVCEKQWSLVACVGPAFVRKVFLQRMLNLRPEWDEPELATLASPDRDEPFVPVDIHHPKPARFGSS